MSDFTKDKDGLGSERGAKADVNADADTAIAEALSVTLVDVPDGRAGRGAHGRLRVSA